MPSGSGNGDEQMGRRVVTVCTRQMGKLRHGAAGRGPLSKKGFGAWRTAEFKSAKALANPSPGQECLLAGYERYWLTPVFLESFSLAALAASYSGSRPFLAALTCRPSALHQNSNRTG